MTVASNNFLKPSILIPNLALISIPLLKGWYSYHGLFLNWSDFFFIPVWLIIFSSNVYQFYKGAIARSVFLFSLLCQIVTVALFPLCFELGRYSVVKTEETGDQLSAEIENYKEQNGHYPEDLDDLQKVFKPQIRFTHYRYQIDRKDRQNYEVSFKVKDDGLAWTSTYCRKSKLDANWHCADE